MKDRSVETASAQAAQTQAAKGAVDKISLDSEVARMLGHKFVDWDDSNHPYVVAEPQPKGQTE